MNSGLAYTHCTHTRRFLCETCRRARRTSTHSTCIHRSTFADRLRAGAGRRSGSGRRPGRVRWGRPLLSRPRGAFGSGAAAVESAADTVLRSPCGRAGVFVGLDGCEVRLCDPCARVRPSGRGGGPAAGCMAGCRRRVRVARQNSQKDLTRNAQDRFLHFQPPSTELTAYATRL